MRRRPSTVLLLASSACLAVLAIVGCGEPGAITVSTPVGSQNTSRPAIGLSTTSVLFSGVRGDGTLAVQTVDVTNAGAGQLSNLLAGPAAYGVGEPTGWLSTNLASSNAPATISLRASVGGLAAGRYSATLDVRSTATGITNSPQTVTVTLLVLQAP